MPSTTPKQARFMAMCAHDPQHAYGKCPSQAVAREFNQADKGTGILRPKGIRQATPKKGR